MRKVLLNKLLMNKIHAISAGRWALLTK